MMKGVHFAGDELLGDSYDINEIEDGFFYEVEGKVRLLQP